MDSSATHRFQLGEDAELMPGVICRVMGDERGVWGEVHIRRDDLEWRDTPHGPQIFPKDAADSCPWIDPSPSA